MRRLRTLFRFRTFGYLALPVAIGAVGAWLYTSRTKQPDSVTVKRGTITEEVSVTGTLKPTQSVDLAFVRSGKISRVSADVGERVAPGTLIAALDESQLLAARAEAEAAAQAAQAKLSELERGPRPEEVRVKEAELENAKSALDDAEINLLDKIRDAYTKADDALRGKTDALFSNPRAPDPTLNYTIGDAALESDLRRARSGAEMLLAAWKTSNDSMNAASDLQTAAAGSRANLDRVAGYLEKTALFINGLQTTTNLSATTIATYRSDVSAARSNVNTATANLSAALEKLSTARSSVVIAERELVLTRAGAAAEAIAAAGADAKQAEATVVKIRAQIEEAELRAPFAGVVTRMNAKIGEIATANAALVSLTADAPLQIEANVPEVDIGRVALSNPVRVSVDALPGETFSGRVAKIDPAETVIEGAVNFKVTVALDRADPRLKSGLTANLAVQTRTHADVLIVPASAVVENDAGTFAQKLEREGTREMPIKIGIRSPAGLVEVTEGLAEGDRVLNAGVRKSP